MTDYVGIDFDDMTIWSGNTNDTERDYGEGFAAQIKIPFTSLTPEVACQYCPFKLKCLTRPEKCDIVLDLGFDFVLNLLERWVENLTEDSEKLIEATNHIQKLKKLMRSCMWADKVRQEIELGRI